MSAGLTPTGEDTTGPFVRNRLSQLAAFAPRLRHPGSSFGQWRGGAAAESADNCVTMPWFQRSRLAEQFNDMLDRTGWLFPDFDWNTWAETPDGQSLMSDRNAIAAANVEQLAKLLTSLVRAERFCEGVLANAFDEGVLLAATERAERLLRDLVPVRP